MNPSVVSEELEGDDEWKEQNAYRVKRKFKRIIYRELSKKDVMPDEEAKMVRMVMWEDKGIVITFRLTYLNTLKVLLNLKVLLVTGYYLRLQLT